MVSNEGGRKSDKRSGEGAHLGPLVKCRIPERAENDMTWHARPLLVLVTVLMAVGGGREGFAQTPMPLPLPAPGITPPGDGVKDGPSDRGVSIPCTVPEAANGLPTGRDVRR